MQKMYKVFAVLALVVLANLPKTEAFVSPYCSPVSPLSSLSGKEDDVLYRLRGRYHSVKSRSLDMTLVPLSRTKTKIIMPRKVTPDQWRSYWGSVPMESVQRVLESVLFAYGGAWMAWFLSFMAGNFISSIAGSIMIFNWIFNPFISAQRQNYRIWYSSQGRMLYHALFRGRIASIQKIRRRSGKTIGQFSQEFVDVIIVDEANRELEIITPWRKEYHALRIGMTIMTVVASKTKSFDDVYNIADAYVPAAGGLWLGDYPFLQKPLFRRVCRKELPDSMVEPDFEGNAENEDEDTNDMSQGEASFSSNNNNNRDGVGVTFREKKTQRRRTSNWDDFESDEDIEVITVDRDIKSSDSRNNSNNSKYLR